MGDSADFGYKRKYDDPEKTVKLQSGDVIVFGGPARMILHAVLKAGPSIVLNSPQLEPCCDTLIYKDAQVKLARGVST